MRRFVNVLAVGYLLLLLALVAALYFFGDGWWPLVVVEYLPRVLFALPFGVLLPAALIWRSRLTAVALALSLLVVLFPLMRLNLASAPSAVAGPSFRVMSFNVYFSRLGVEGVLAQIDAAKADVVLLQAMGKFTATEKALSQKWTVRVDGEFLLATRFPIREVFVPPTFDDNRPAMFMRYTLETPLGLVDVFSVHPYSPRSGFSDLRGGGLRSTLANGGPTAEATTVVEQNVDLRRRQLEAALDAVAHAQHPVLLAGDTNLPGLSPLDRLLTEKLRDGFASVGFGFGYTFPANKKWRPPWMRIDRVLTGAGLKVTHFAVGGRGASDHAPVIADVARGPTE